jgi:hypothetical protein
MQLFQLADYFASGPLFLELAGGLNISMRDETG